MRRQRMLNKILEMIDYDGYTYAELCAAAGGGGKSGQVAPQAPTAMNTKTAVGSQLDAPEELLEEDSEEEITAIEKKKMGTRGLQIPLADTQSTTVSAAGTGARI